MFRLCWVLPVVCGASLDAQGLSFPTKDQTHDPCTGRKILNHWATGGVPGSVAEKLCPSGHSKTQLKGRV